MGPWGSASPPPVGYVLVAPLIAVRCDHTDRRHLRPVPLGPEGDALARDLDVLDADRLVRCDCGAILAANVLTRTTRRVR